MDNKRNYYLDNIRTAIILCLFLWHICEMYHLKESFYVEGRKSLLPTLIYNFSSVWAMSTLFFIAGITTMYSLQKRTLKEFYIERLKKLGVPFILGIVFLVPLQAYWTLKNHTNFQGNLFDVYRIFFTTYTEGFYGYDGGFTPGHLWFIAYLIVIVLLSFPLIKYRKTHVGPMKITVNHRCVLMIAVIIWLLSYGNSDEGIGRFLLFYWLGILLYDSASFFEYTVERRKILFGSAVFLDAVLSVALIAMKDMKIFSWKYAALRFLWSLACVLSVMALIGFGQAFWNTTNRIMQYLGERSFAIYILHMPILLTIAHFVLTNTSYGFGIQFFLILVPSVPVTLLFVEIFRRIPVVKMFFGMTGRTTGKTAAEPGEKMKYT